MAVKFSVAEGGFVQDTSISGKLEFRVKGYIENPDLEVIAAPTYTSDGLTISSATLVVLDGRTGSFKVEIRSVDDDGTNETTHISQTITVSSDGPLGQALTVDVAAIPSSKVVKLYTQHVSGSVSSDISVILE